MKIIKQGNAPQDIIYKGTCNKCSSEFECYKKELTSMTDRNENYYYAKCLVCDNEYVYFNEK